MTLGPSREEGAAPKPAATNLLQQQARFDAWLTPFNQERPHQALAMRTPAEVYTPSARAYRGLPPLAYPWHDWTATVTHCGRICRHNRKINLSQVFAGQLVGVRQETDRIWLVTIRSGRPCHLSLWNELLPMSPEWTR